MENKDYELFDEQVDRFLRHQMSEEEESQFRSQLQSDATLMERAKVMALMIKSMDEIGHEQDQEIVSAIQQMSEDEFRRAAGLPPIATNILITAANILPAANISGKSFWHSFVRYAAVACVIGSMAFGGIKYYDYRQTASLGESQYMAYAQDIADVGYMRGAGQDVVIDELQQLFANIREGKDLKETISRLESLYEQSKDEDSEYFEFDNDIAWNLSIGYLKIGDKKSPIPILEDMIQRNKSYREIYQPAQNLIDQIRRL